MKTYIVDAFEETKNAARDLMKTLAVGALESEHRVVEAAIGRLKPVAFGKTDSTWKEGLAADADIAAVIAHAKLTICADPASGKNIGKTTTDAWTHLKKVAFSRRVCSRI
jgi:hypothetical protein